MKTIPFWQDDFPRPNTLPMSVLPQRVDVAVIGGGLTGLAAAYTLAKSGVETAVLEQDRIGSGASSRHAGIVTTGFRQSLANLFDLHGEALGRQLWQASLEAVDLVGEIVADEGITCDFTRRGHLTLAIKPSHYTSMKTLADWLDKEMDFSVQLLSPTETETAVGSQTYHGGMVNAWSASLHPTKYLYGLAGAVARHGGLLCEKTAVTRLEKIAQGFNIHTSQGTVQARELLLATNGYSGKLVRPVQRLVFPMNSVAIVTEPLTAAQQQLLNPDGWSAQDSRWLPHYFRLTPDGRFLFGTHRHWRLGLDLLDCADGLRQQMIKHFPLLTDVPLAHVWGGNLGQTFDMVPHIGRLNGVHFALGYSGQGVALSAYLGCEAGLLLSGQKRTSPFVVIRPVTHFYYRQRARFAPLLGHYYRFLDWIS
ncbi:NAD(P)/FAD-dependent oxidoreductase [Candidatus Leptofilum sp.]|uniref:NAD(P)/FAD-dependent oxidoreductase n=1 Tax=Candidatus Leptofilum sp. TaxID=3241576 RepID=UPI003B596515